MKILSLFDWMSCGRIALERAWIVVDTYMAAEIDKYAIQVSKENYPEIIQLWDVNNWMDWDIGEIDMIIGGSPCQWFSFAGKQLAFDDPRSKLFFTMVDIINHYKPKYFLLENVKMKKEFQDIITEYMWVNHIEINSSLLSAQNRKRLYRVGERQEDGTYKKVHIEQPKDKWILLKDIIEEDGEDIADFKNCVRKNIVWVNILNYLWDNWFICIPVKSWFQDHKIWITKTPTLRAWNSFCLIQTPSWGIRTITPIEAERLQTVPDWYTSIVSNSQRYKMLGNWWTVDVIAHIFSYLK